MGENTIQGRHSQTIIGRYDPKQIKRRGFIELPPSVKRNHEFEEICKSLEGSFGGTMKTSHNIVKNHLAAGKIPDPLKNPYEIYGKTLDEHHEIIKKTEHFLSLSSEKDADIEILTESNLTKILDLLPDRIRVESDVLSALATNIKERRI